MLKSDIFFLFPPGYAGNYLQWSICASEIDSAHKVTKNPLLNDGTSHGFIRRPTHANVYNILQWIIRHNCVQPQTYIINCFNVANKNLWHNHSAYVATTMFKCRPESAVINLHAKEHDDIKFGFLNTYTKWPTYFVINNIHDPTLYDFDQWAGQTQQISLKDRNWFYDNVYQSFPINQPFNWEEFNYNVHTQNQWVNIRNQLQPWEITLEDYPLLPSSINQQIIDIPFQEIFTVDFFDRVFIPNVESLNIGNFNWDYVKTYHTTYLQAQKNISWYSDIERMRNYKEVGNFLMSNSLSQALALMEIDNLSILTNWRELKTSDVLQYFGFNLI